MPNKMNSWPALPSTSGYRDLPAATSTTDDSLPDTDEY
jgi:hypothetical protein